MKKPLKKPMTNRYGDVRGLTREDFKRFRPTHKVDPMLAAAYKAGKLKYRGQRGPQKAPTKSPVSIRLSQDILLHFKATGAGWQTRLDEALRLLISPGLRSGR